jgi:esterase
MNTAIPFERRHVATPDGLHLAVTQWGPPDGTPIVVLHGLRSYAQTFSGLAAALQPGWRVIGLDQRGRGESDWDPQQRYDTLTYVADLETLVDTLALPQFHLLGHSMGGANAIVYAARHPQRVRSLVIEDMGPGASASSAGAERIQRELADTPQRFADWAAARAFWRSIRPGVTEEAIDSRVRYSLRDDPEHGGVVWRHDQEGIAQARRRIAPVDLWPHMLAIRCPVLLVRGAQSDFLSETTADAVAERCPQVRHVAIEGAGHYVHDDAPEAFQGTVRAFLDAQP